MNKKWLILHIFALIVVIVISVGDYTKKFIHKKGKTQLNKNMRCCMSQSVVTCMFDVTFYKKEKMLDHFLQCSWKYLAKYHQESDAHNSAH